MTSNDTVRFTEKAVKEYLDECIVFWREKKVKAEKSRRVNIGVADVDDMDAIQDILVAKCYIDAYQSVRTSLFGELMAVEE